MEMWATLALDKTHGSSSWKRITLSHFSWLPAAELTELRLGKWDPEGSVPPWWEHQELASAFMWPLSPVVLIFCPKQSYGDTRRPAPQSSRQEGKPGRGASFPAGNRARPNQEETQSP